MKSFLQGRKSLPIAALRPPASPRPAPAAGPRPSAALQADHTAPHVEVVKQGDKVTRLIVTCACGERVEIDCLYPAG